MSEVLVSAYSLRSLLRQNAAGIRVVGYTVRPGYSNGLFMYARLPVGGYVGWSRSVCPACSWRAAS